MRKLMLLLLPITMWFAAPADAQTFGTGWTGEYYNSLDISGQVIARQTNLSGLRFDWVDGSSELPTGVNVDRFSARFTSTQFFPQSATYRFIAGSDDGVRLYVDDQIYINSFFARPYTEDVADVFLEAGEHTIRVEYVNDGGSAILNVRWQVADSIAGAPAAPPPVSNAPSSGIVGAVQNAEGLSVRSGPFLGASRLTIIAPGTQYPISARNDAEGEFTWYLITVSGTTTDALGNTVQTGSGTVGWVSGRYFVPTADTSNVPTETTVFETLTPPAEDSPVTGVTRSNMRLRAGASYRTSTLRILDWGAEFEILGRTLQAKQNHWFYVRTPEGEVGWVYAPFITIRGDINLVPTY